MKRSITMLLNYTMIAVEGRPGAVMTTESGVTILTPCTLICVAPTTIEFEATVEIVLSKLSPGE